jgi:hypothetical protein
MSTQIYPPGKYTEKQIKGLIQKQTENEIMWYMSEFISTQLEPIRDALSFCIKNLDDSDETIYKLPLSSHKSEVLKGTLTRQNFKIITLHMTINSPNFNNGKRFEFELKQSEYLIIRQLLDCHDAMENAITNLDKILENKKNGNNADLFVRYIEQVCANIKLALESLSSPNPVYNFPKYRIPGEYFLPSFPKTGSLDILINEGELVIEFKSLKIVDKKPWDVIIDPINRLSFADIVRNQISRKREIPMNKIVADEYSKYLEWKKIQHKEENKESSSSGTINTFKNIFVLNTDPSISTLIKTANTYLEQCLTFVDDENKPFVVQVADKCEVVTSDPVLLSINVKLESIEKTMSRVQENLSNIYA